MANPNRPMGFAPVGTLGGSPWNARVRRYQAGNRSADTTNNHGDIYVGDPVKFSSGLLLPANSGDTIDGVVVAVGEQHSVNPDGISPFNPNNLAIRYSPLAVTSGVYIYICPTIGVIFESQTALALTLSPAANLDI